MGTLDTSDIRNYRLPTDLVRMPALGFGTLIPDPLATKQAITTALEVGFRHFDCAERYRNEQAVGDAMQGMFRAGNDSSGRTCLSPRSSGTIIIAQSGSDPPSKRVGSASRSTTSIAISSIPLWPSNRATRQDPRDERGQVIYDPGVTLVETWRALERLVDEGRCKVHRLI